MIIVLTIVQSHYTCYGSVKYDKCGAKKRKRKREKKKKKENQIKWITSEDKQAS